MQLRVFQRPLRGWFCLFLGVNVADLVCTFLILQRGMVKDNPLATFLLEHVGIAVVMLVKVALVAGVTLIIHTIAKRSPEACELACNLLIGLSGVVLLLFTATAAISAITYF